MSYLYLPIEQAIIIPAQIRKDMSNEEFDDEMESMFVRSKLASAVLITGVGLEDLVDCIVTQGIDSDSYLDSIEEWLRITLNTKN
jgi:alpha-acetolactate decarboxylase